MTTPIAPGDLVLRNGRAEEVTGEGRDHISRFWKLGRGVGQSQIIVRNEPYNTSSPPLWRQPETLTRIGSTLPPENWRIHTGGERPEGVGARDRVEVFYRRGQPSVRALQGGAWFWDLGDDMPSQIVAYRVAQRAERPANPTPDLRAVAASPADMLREAFALAKDMKDADAMISAANSLADLERA